VLFLSDFGGIVDQLAGQSHTNIKAIHFCNCMFLWSCLLCAATIKIKKSGTQK
jgi:hypothetical protein